MSRIKALLICRNWESDDARHRLVDWSTQSRYMQGILYAYKNMYDPQLTVVARLDELPAAPEP